MRDAPCPYCQGAGTITKWVSLSELANMLEKAEVLECAERLRKQPTSQYQDSRDAADI